MIRPLPQVDTPPLLSIQDLWVRRGPRSVLSGITADIPRGCITAIVGLNGSGKSTLLRTLLGEFPVQRGSIRFRCGHDHSRHRPEYVGYVPQRLAIDTNLPITVRDLLALALNRGRPIFFGFRRNLERQMTEMLSVVGAERQLDVPVEGLSGGQLQRILLALALQPHPELLLLDEPAAGIDFRDQDEFYKLISGVNQRTGVTVMLVSHELQTVSQFAHHVLCLRNGVISQSGHPRDILTSGRVEEIFGRKQTSSK